MKNRLKIKLKNDCSAFSSAVNWWWRYLTDKLSNRCEARIVEVPGRRRPRTTGLQQGTISARPQPRDKKQKTPYLRWTAKRRTSSTREDRVRGSLRIGNEHEKQFLRPKHEPSSSNRGEGKDRWDVEHTDSQNDGSPARGDQHRAATTRQGPTNIVA